MTTNYSIVGVCGHIDHGKTSLVQTLTGIETDTQPEEKRRGITIDLGFADCDIGGHRFAFIDAPGHQRYIGSLLAGVAAIDIGLLVIAADQGVQAQTVEHLSILNAFQTPNILIAVSRIDLVSEEVLKDLLEEIQLFVDDAGMPDLPIIPFSNVSQEGIEDITRELQRFGALSGNRSPSNDPLTPVRLPVDRVLSKAGRGLVVAGTLWSGSISVNDTLGVAGTNKVFRVREIENHHSQTPNAAAGSRLALNLVGQQSHDFQRGDELITPGGLVQSTRLVVELHMFDSSAASNRVANLRSPSEVQLHGATASRTGKIFGASDFKAGETKIAIIDLASPLLVQSNQILLLRKPYPFGSFASARVLAAFHDKAFRTEPLLKLGSAISEGVLPSAIKNWVTLLGTISLEHANRKDPTDPVGLYETVNAFTDAIMNDVADTLTLRNNWLMSTELVDKMESYACKILTKQSNEPDVWILESVLAERLGTVGKSSITDEVLHRLRNNPNVVEYRGRFAMASDATKLSKSQKTRLNQLIDLVQQQRSPPVIKELAQQIGVPLETVQSLARFAESQSAVLQISKDLVFDRRVIGTLVNELQSEFSLHANLTVSEIRQFWGLSRKYVIPLLEYFDQHEWTIRDGETRRVGPRLKEFLDQNAED